MDTLEKPFTFGSGQLAKVRDAMNLLQALVDELKTLPSDECNQNGDFPKGQFATLVVSRPGIEYRYRITPDDVLWTARMMEGEAGGRANDDNYAVVWAMLNRWALLTNPQRLKKSGYKSFADFIRNYSTPLQSMLKYGSAKHHYKSPDYVKLGGYYEGTNVPRGQLRRYIQLQKTCWSRLKPSSRKAAEAVMKGEAPNPIGLATEFANTATYYRRKHNAKPTIEQWREYTNRFGLSKRFTKDERGNTVRTRDKRGWVWIGDRTNLNQYGQNTFFLRTRPVSGDPTEMPIAEMSADTVQLLPSSEVRRDGIARELGVTSSKDSSRCHEPQFAGVSTCVCSRCIQAGECKLCERRISWSKPRELAPVPSDLTYLKRAQRLEREALEAYKTLYAAAPLEAKSGEFLKLASGYRDYETDSSAWRNSLLAVFKMLGCQASDLRCLAQAIDATDGALRIAAGPLACNAWNTRFSAELKKRGCSVLCDAVKLDWLAKKYKMSPSDPVNVAVHHKRQTLAPATSSPHGTGRALDLYLGGALSAAPENVRKQRATAAYRWMACNAARFGFYPYNVEPWHWEYNPPEMSSRFRS